MVLPSALATVGSYCLFLFFFIHAILPSSYLRHVKRAPAEWCWFCFFGRFALSDDFDVNRLIALTSTRARRVWDPGIDGAAPTVPRLCFASVLATAAIPGSLTVDRDVVITTPTTSFFHCSHPVLSRPTAPTMVIGPLTTLSPCFAMIDCNYDFPNKAEAPSVRPL